MPMPMLRLPACLKTKRTETRLTSPKCMRFVASRMKPCIGSSTHAATGGRILSIDGR